MSNNNRAFILYDYSGEGISVKVGEEITIIEYQNEWCLIRKLDSVEGAVPSSYIETNPNIINIDASKLLTEYAKFNLEKTSEYFSDEDEEDDDEDKDESNKQSLSTSQQSLSASQQSISNKIVKKFITKKSELDDYFLEPNLTFFPGHEIIFEKKDFQVWKPKTSQFEVFIINHSIDKKFGGLKKYVNYELKIEKNNHTVKRHYKQFQWLQERFEKKYPNICIPPLVEKQLSRCKHEHEYVDEFKLKLGLWLNKVSAHPVLRESDVFMHFLECSVESKWKNGKRLAEKDEISGTRWFQAVSVPSNIESSAYIKERINTFEKAATNLDNNMKQVVNALDKIVSYNDNYYKKELANLGKSFEDLGTVLRVDSLDACNNVAISKAILNTGNVYTQIAHLYGQQAKNDAILLDELKFLRGVVQQMPCIIQFEKSSLSVYEDLQNKPEKLKGRSILKDVKPRQEIISHVTFSEINHFNQDKSDDLYIFMKTFLKKQIDFYAQITENLKNNYKLFENISVEKKSHF